MWSHVDPLHHCCSFDIQFWLSILVFINKLSVKKQFGKEYHGLIVVVYNRWHAYAAQLYWSSSYEVELSLSKQQALLFLLANVAAI